MPYVIAVCHQKGGVAKTTTTVALGASFAEMGMKTLLVDLDPQANLTSSVGLDSDAMERSIAEVLLGEADLGAVTMETKLPGLDIIPASASMLTLARQLFQVPEFEHRLRKVLTAPVVQKYDLLLLDCPPSVGSITVNALTATDLLIIPTQCEYFSIQALTDMFQLVRLIRNRTNPSLAYRLLVTMFDGRGTFHKRMLEFMRGQINHGLLNTVIGFDTKLRESQMAGSPVTTHAPHSRGAMQYRQLAEELKTYVTHQ